METNENTVLNNTENNTSKIKDNKVLMGGIIAAVILVLAAGIGFGIYNSPSNRLSRQLDLGQKYLEEMDYEQAKIAFEEAIAIDPKCAEAYLGAAGAYAGLEDYEGAAAILQKGYEQTGDESLKMQLEEYEEKLEQEAQRMEEEVYDLLDASLVEHDMLIRFNPTYTYSHLNQICSEIVPQLLRYVEMNISDDLKMAILYRVHNCYLSINDLGKAKEYWMQYIELCNQNEMEYGDETYQYDEYGRIVFSNWDIDTVSYGYYDNTGLLKTEIRTTSCDKVGYSDIERTEYEEYDEEGRLLSKTEYRSCGYETANASSMPADYPVENYIVREYSYTYEMNTCKMSCDEKIAYVNNGGTAYVTSRQVYRTTYDEAGNMILQEIFDKNENLLSKIEYDGDGNMISETSY